MELLASHNSWSEGRQKRGAKVRVGTYNSGKPLFPGAQEKQANCQHKRLQRLNTRSRLNFSEFRIRIQNPFK